MDLYKIKKPVLFANLRLDVILHNPILSYLMIIKLTNATPNSPLCIPNKETYKVPRSVKLE